MRVGRGMASAVLYGGHRRLVGWRSNEISRCKGHLLDRKRSKGFKLLMFATVAARRA
jgi:hypothetical protein